MYCIIERTPCGEPLPLRLAASASTGPAWSSVSVSVSVLLVFISPTLQPDGVTALSAASHEDSAALTQLLLDHGAAAQVNTRFGSERTTALFNASRLGFVGVVQALLQAGANLDAAGVSVSVNVSAYECGLLPGGGPVRCVCVSYYVWTSRTPAHP